MENSTTNRFNGKKVLVAGASGFIPSWLCERLLSEGCEVWGLDNHVTGNPKNLDIAAQNPNFHLVKWDITQWPFPSELPKDFSAVINCASPASPEDFKKIPIEIMRVGSLGTEHLLMTAKESGARFLQASTSEVYGDPLEHPQKETYWGNVNPNGPRSCYDEAKRYAEGLIMAYHRVHSVNTGIFRIFNTYGPRNRLDDGRVVPQFMTQSLKGEDLTIYGEGNQTRSFCFVQDLVEGIWRLLNSDFHEPVNLGMPKEHTIKQFAEKVIEATGSNSKIVHKPLPKDDPKQRCPDITRAKEVLNWEPKVSLEDGLKITMDYYKSQI